jgi:hypothetical protein
MQVDQKLFKYVESQPWPFPSSLMIAFTANLPVGKGEMHLSDGCKSREALAAAADSGIKQSEIAECAPELPLQPSRKNGKPCNEHSLHFTFNFEGGSLRKI